MDSDDLEETPRRKLSIIHLLAPAMMGGLERVVHTLAAGHHARGHHVCVGAVLSPAPGVPPFLESLSSLGVRVVPLHVSVRGYARERQLVADLCVSVQPDVVHTHGYRSDLLDAWSARRAGFPTVTTVHGFTHSDWKNQLYQVLQRRSARLFDAVVAVSRPIADLLIDAGTPPPKVYVVPNALPDGQPPLSISAARQALQLSEAPLRIGWVGRISRDKGLDVLVDALQYVRDLPWVVSVIGDGPDAASVRANAIALGLDDRFDWHGSIAEAGCLMSAFDVLVLSSRTEGTPLVLLEAMAANVPVIASRVGGVPDVVSEREALLVSAENPRDLAAALRRHAMDCAAAMARAAAAHERLQDFRVEPWLVRYEEIYSSVCVSSREAAR